MFAQVETAEAASILICRKLLSLESRPPPLQTLQGFQRAALVNSLGSSYLLFWMMH